MHPYYLKLTKSVRSIIYMTINCEQDFKGIVEELLGELMAELGVTDTQFLEACEKAEANPIHKKIVD